jgi:hypothetical protein
LDRLVVVAVGCAYPALAAAAAFEPVLAHEPLHALMVADVAFTPQLLRDSWAAIPAFLLAMNPADLLGQEPIGDLTRALLAIEPGIVAAARDLQHRAELPHRVVFSHLFDHTVALL